MRALLLVVVVASVGSATHTRAAHAETEAPLASDEPAEAPAADDKAKVDIRWIAPRLKKPKGPAHEVKQAKVSSRVISETTYAHGIKHGPHTGWYDNGQVYEEGGFEDGLRAGAWTRYNKNGNVARRWSYKLGLVHGVSTIYSSTEPDKVISTATYAFGKKHGPAEEFFHGTRSGRGEYWNDQKHGTWTYFHRDGSVRTTVHYTCGRKTPAESPGMTAGTVTPCPVLQVTLPTPEFVAGGLDGAGLRKAKWEIAVKLLVVSVCRSGDSARVFFAGKDRACRKIYFRSGNTVAGPRG